MYIWYIIITFVTTVLLFIQKSNQKEWRPSRLFLSIIILCLICIAAFRPENAIDVGEYIAVIENHSVRMEPTFQYIVKFTDGFPNQYLIIFFIFACLSISTRIIGLLKYSKYFLASFMVYLSNIFILHDNIQIRAAVASALLLHIIEASIKKKLYFFIVLVLTATLFHYSAAVFGLIWFIKKDKTNRMLYCSLIALSYLLYLMGIRFGYLVSSISAFSELISFFQTKGDQINVFNVLQLIHITICLLLWRYVYLIKSKSDYILVCLKIYTIGIVFLPLLSDVPTLAFRLNEFGISVESILIGSCTYFIFKNRASAVMFILLYSTIIFVFSLVTYITSVH